MLQLPVLETKQVLTILQQVAQEERNQEQPNMPKVTISSNTGNASGYFIDFQEEKGVILIGNWYANQVELQYVNFFSISSISITNIDEYLYLLSDGKIPFVPNANQVPTMLKLKREIKAADLALQEAIGKEVSLTFNAGETPSDTEKFYAKKAIQFLKETLLSLAENELAKEAFSESIDTINFEISETNEVQLNERVLGISLNLKKGWKSIFSKIELQNEIEKNL